MVMFDKSLVSEKISSVNDDYLNNLRQQWYEGSHKQVNRTQFITQAQEWFTNSPINNVVGYHAFPVIDVIQGCTQFFENVILKYGRSGVQTLPVEYAYYSLMGMYGTDPGELEPNKPLLVSLPHCVSGDIRPDWSAVLKECEQKNIDIHVDMAWIIKSKDIKLDLDHPNIKSFGMSMSKLSLEWNRIGLRWSRQQQIDSITIANHYYKGIINTGAMSCGAYMMNNLDRDYAWNTYGNVSQQICDELDLEPTKFVHVARSKQSGRVVGIGRLFPKSTPSQI